MTQYQLLGKTYEIPKTSADFLDSYIKRLKTYISNNNISENYLDDIIERINDKLTQLEIESSPIKNADIIKIVNDIGEAEDIFPKEPKDSPEKTSVQNMFQKGLKRDTENAILFGVCAGIARHISIDPLWIRIIFIILIFTGGIGIVIYIILIFLIPSDNKVKIESTKESSSGIINQLASMVGYSFRGIFRLTLIILFAVIGFGLIGCFIGGVIVSGVVLSGSFEIGNQQFLSNIPEYLRFAVPLLTTITLVIVVAIFSNIIGKDLFGKKGWLTLSILTAIGFILLASGTFDLVKDYSWMDKKNIESEYVFTGKTIEIKNQLDINDDNNPINGTMNFVRIEKNDSLTGKILIKTTETFYTKNQEIATKIRSSNNAPVYTFSGNTLILAKNIAGDFKDIVPFSFFHRQITITIPQNISLKNIHGRYDEVYSEEFDPPKIPNTPDEIELP